MFADGIVVGMLSKHDVEGLRRSQAMAPLSPGQVNELLETCARLTREREALVAIVAELPATFSSLRGALNSIHRLLADEPDRAGGRNSAMPQDAVTRW